MDLIVSCSRGQYRRAKPEIIRILQRFGDPGPAVEKTDVSGVAVAHSGLDNRAVVKACRALWHSDPLDSFEFALKWVPVDYWCATDLVAIKQVVDANLRERIAKYQTWGMKVYKRRWQRYHTREIVEYLAADIEQRVDLGHPERILRVDVVGRRTAISLLAPDEIFSIRVACP